MRIPTLIALAALPAALAAQTTFTTRDVPTCRLPVSVEAGDLDGDGDPDLVTAHGEAEIVCAARNTGRGATWSSSTLFAYPPLSFPADAVVADLDGQGRDDVAVVLERASLVAIHLADAGWPGFGAPTFVAVPPGPIELSPIDADGDGDLDLAVICELSQVLQIVRNDGGVFGISTAVPLQPAIPRALAVGDMNGDGRTDLAITASQGVSGVLLAVVNTTPSATAAPAFAPPSITPVGRDPYGVAIGDLDGDGYPDAAVLAGGDAAVEVLRNDPRAMTGSTLGFTRTAYALAPATILLPEFTEIGMADFDGDGDLDAVASCDSTDVVAALWNDGFGTLAGPSFFASPRFPGDLTIADFDRDGEPDVATANFVSSSIGVLFADLESGRCDHRLVAGIPDDFDPSLPTALEDACVGAALGGWSGLGRTRAFDVDGCGARLAHTFDGLPDRIDTATLVIRLRASCATSGDDRLELGFDAANGRTLWSRPIEALAGVPWVPPATEFVTLDLAELPGGLSLLPKIAAQDRLDVVVGPGTAVDFVALSLRVRGAAATPLVHRATPYVPGTTFEWSVAGTPIGPGSGTAILLGRGLGAGPAIPGGELCITGPAILGVVANGPGGSTRFGLPVPALALPECTTLTTQAVSWGPGFRPVLHSNTLVQTVFD